MKVNSGFLEYVNQNEGYLPGAKDGDLKCVNVDNWYEAYKRGLAPAVVVDSTNFKVFEYAGKLGVNLIELKEK